MFNCSITTQEKLTFGPVAKTKEQQGKAGIIEPKSEKNATDQANDGQAGADAGTAQKKGKAKKEQPDKDYTPAYTEAEEAILKVVTDVCKAEIAGAPDKYGAVSSGNNRVLSLKECKKAGAKTQDLVSKRIMMERLKGSRRLQEDQRSYKTRL